MAFKYKIKENPSEIAERIMPSETGIVCFDENIAQEIAGLHSVHVLYHKTPTNIAICNNGHWHEINVGPNDVAKLYHNFKLLIVQDSVKRLAGAFKTAIGINLNVADARIMIEILTQADIPRKMIGGNVTTASIKLSDMHQYDHIAILVGEAAAAKSAVSSILQLQSRPHSLHLRPGVDIKFIGLKGDESHVMREESASFGLPPRKIPIFLLEN